MPDIRALAATVVVVVFSALPVAGQEGAPADARFQPYTFVAPGGVSNGGATMHVGGGVDILLWKGLGASVEGGYLGPIEAFDYGIGVVSTNAFYQVGRPAKKRLTPFVTGGYTLGFRGQSVNAINIGGGANYWLTDRLGLRFEVRDHLPVVDGIRDEHLWGVRFGVTWRR
jgi:hypothetical protein